MRDESSVSLIQNTMKQRNQNALTWGLFIFLVLSLLLNWVQTNHIDQLREEVEDMEQLQTVLTTYINELESVEKSQKSLGSNSAK